MSNINTSQKNIIVTGDVTMDWNLVRVHQESGNEFSWNPDVSTSLSWQRGGAALLADLISQINADLQQGEVPPYAIFQSDSPTSSLDPTSEDYNHSYAIWSQFNDGKQKIWRVAEFLGLDRFTPIGSPLPILEEPPDANLVIIDDAGISFRDHPEAWPKCLTNSAAPPWVILKMSQPIGHGKLWDHLTTHFSDRLIVLTTVNDLRQTEVQISQGLSWERTAQDAIWELTHNTNISTLAKCASVVISFGPDGAVVHQCVGNKPASQANQLVFDPAVIEGEWIAKHSGGMIGYTSCLAAGIARQLMLDQDTSQIIQGVQTGLSAMRDLHLNGYSSPNNTGECIQFPLERIANVLQNAAENFSVVGIQDPVRFLFSEPNSEEVCPNGGYWSILQDRYRGDLGEICNQIVLQGAKSSLTDVPQGIFGGLFTVDRQEIESFRSISALAKEYLNLQRPKRPLSIGVFGAPGSGKSFGITQVAKTLAPERIEVLEFNLSQFEASDELIAAMHQVRDVNLCGKFPLVFWDEFDTPHGEKSLGWLRYFLSPMQDGKFREGQLNHSIGPAIFVFAGGTSEKMEFFGNGLDEKTLRESKVPDFVSRLKGFVNVMGPNPQKGEGKNDAWGDPFYKIRRAILLRAILSRSAPHLLSKKDGLEILNIDQGVLRAFLNVRFYKHGIRSMESIIAMSQLSGKKIFERSSLPPEKQLDLHVDGQEFLSLVQQIELTEEILEKMASLFHKHFCNTLEDQGYVNGSVTDDNAKTHSSLKSFDALPPDEQEQNRDAARDVYNKLTVSGYIMIPARSNEKPFKFPGDFLEKLSRLEHERWMRLKISDGWQYAEVTDKANKLHADLVPWEELSPSARKKDEEFVLAIPHILAQAGYTIAELSPINRE
jgi:hypothetical protein